MNLRVTFNRIAAIAALASPNLFAPGVFGVNPTSEDVSSIAKSTKEPTSTKLLEAFDYIGTGGCLAAGGEKAQKVDWNFPPQVIKNDPEDCARHCLTEEQNELYGFFGFDIGYGRCRCFYAAGDQSAFPVRLNTNGGYKCFAFDLPGMCDEQGFFPQAKLRADE